MNYSCRSDNSDAGILQFRDKDVSIRSNSNAYWAVKHRARTCTVSKALRCVSRKRGYEARGRYGTNAAVSSICNKHGPISINCKAVWSVEQRVGSFTVSKARESNVPRECSYDACGRHGADAVGMICNVHESISADSDAGWISKPRVCPLTVGNAICYLSRKRNDYTRGCDGADSVRARVGNEHVTVSGKGDAIRSKKHCVCPHAIRKVTRASCER